MKRVVPLLFLAATVQAQTYTGTGEVQKFGEAAPQIESRLMLLGSKDECRFSVKDMNSREQYDTFKPGERFCLLLHSHENVYAGVFALYSDNNQLKISRLYPEGKTQNLQLKAGDIPALTAIAAQPLPGMTQGHESLFIIASRTTINTQYLIQGDAGNSAAQTANNSINMAAFDRALGKLDLNAIRIQILPYAVGSL